MMNWINRILSFFKRNRYHFIGWAVFIVYEVSAISFIVGSSKPIGQYLLYYSLNILFFYTHSLIILPFSIKQEKKRGSTFVLLITSEWIAYILIVYTLLFLINNAIFYAKLVDFSYFIGITWRCVYFMGLSSIYYLFQKLKFENIRNMKLEKERFNSVIERKDIEYELTQSNYAYLRARINPHLLFNLLNFLRNKVEKISANVADAMHVLSEMMQYSLGATGKEKFVLVSEELEQVKNLIYLNQLRFDNKLKIDLSYSKDVLEFKIPPLVLLTLVENMFKHGDLTVSDKRAFIRLSIENGKFYITAANALAVKRNDRIKSRTGLDNVKKRLNLAYNDAASLECVLDKHYTFFVNINIPVSTSNSLSIEAVERSDTNYGGIFSHNRNKNHKINRVFDFFKKNKYHFIGWAVFIVWEICAIGFATGKFSRIEDYALYYIFNILFFYFQVFIVLPAVFNQQKTNIVVLCFIAFLECIVYSLISLIIIPAIAEFLNLKIEVAPNLDLKLYFQVAWRFLYFVGFSWAYYLFRRLNVKNQQNLELERVRFREIIKKKDIEQELIKSNYAYLQAQINPHFLFNVLNFMYDETKKSSKEVSDAIMILSEMMQYSLGGLQQEFVAVSEEVEQVEHLIYLHQLQCDNTLQIEFNYSDEVMHLEIIPLVLLTLVENMFEHGDFTSPNKKASINVYIEYNVFHIVTINHLRIDSTELGRGADLDNIKKRLAFAYRDTGVLEYAVDEQNQFIAQITIPIPSLTNPAILQTEYPNS